MVTRGLSAADLGVWGTIGGGPRIAMMKRLTVPMRKDDMKNDNPRQLELFSDGRSCRHVARGPPKPICRLGSTPLARGCMRS
jgi:hypothetical protein